MLCLHVSCLDNPRNRGAWWAAVYGVTQSRTRLTRLSSSSSSMTSRGSIFFHCGKYSVGPFNLATHIFQFWGVFFLSNFIDHLFLSAFSHLFQDHPLFRLVLKVSCLFSFIFLPLSLIWGNFSHLHLPVLLLPFFISDFIFLISKRLLFSLYPPVLIPWTDHILFQLWGY